MFALRVHHRNSLTSLLWLSLAVGLGVAILVASPMFVMGIGVGLLLIFASIKSPIASLIILLILAPLRTLIATEAPWALPMDIGQALFVCFLASYAVRKIIRRDMAVPGLSWLAGALLFFLLVTSTGILVAWDLGNWLSEWLKWWTILVVMFVSTDIGRGRRWHWLIFGVVLGAFANALVGIYIFLGGSGADHLLVGERFFRAFGTFGQPNPFGGFMGMVLPVAFAVTLGWSVACWRQWRQGTLTIASSAIVVCYGLMSVFISVGLLVSWSRGAWLSILIGLGVMAFALPRQGWQRMGLLMAGVGLVVFVWTSGILPESVAIRLMSSTEELFVINDVRGVDITSDNYAVIERLAHWQSAVMMAEAHPWLGVGFGNYAVAYDAYRLINWREALGHAHNYYLNILAETGIIGALAYAFVWGVLLVKTWRLTHHPDFMVRIVACGLFGSWAYILSHSLLDSLYVNNLFLHIGVLLGAVVVLHQQLSRFTSWGHYVTN